MGFLYSAYGLTLRTPLLCEGLIEADSGTVVDVDVVEGSVPRQLPNPAVRDAAVDATPGLFLLRGGSHSARFLVEQGTRVTFERNSAYRNDLFQHHFLHPVMAAILRHRQRLVLHASAAANSATTVVVAGESGAGKSTTVAALAAQGWHMLSDDIVALRLNEQGCLEVLPGAMHVHLHADAAAALPLDTAGLTRSEWHRQKMALPLRKTGSDRPCMVNRLIHLEKLPSAGVRAESVAGREKLPLLLRSLYGPVLPSEMAAGFDLFAAALKDVQVLSVARPHDAWTLNEIIEVVSHD
jgi:hypothetical protein